MDNRSVGFGARAAECLKLAAHVTDRNLRSAFVAMAERLLDMAEEHSRADALTDPDSVNRQRHADWRRIHADWWWWER